MSSQLAKYRVDDDTDIDPEWWNKIVGDLDARLVGLESSQAGVDQVIDQLVQIGLTRINETLLPAFQEIEGLASLGDLLRASSASSIAIGTGPVTWVIDEADRAHFAAPLFIIAAVAGSTDKWMAGQVTAWDADTGALQIEVTNTRGTGTYAAWDISVASIPPETPPAQSADGVTVTPAGGIVSTNVQAALEELDGEVAANAAAAATNAGDIATNAAAIATKAPLASPALTGTPTAPTPTQGDNTTALATTAFVAAALDALIAAAPGALDTLNELAAALGDDPNFAATMTAALAGKVATSRQIGAAGLATGGGDLSANRTITVPGASQAQAEAGTNDTTAMTPLKTAQAIAALGPTEVCQYTTSSDLNLTDYPIGQILLVGDPNQAAPNRNASHSVYYASTEIFSLSSTGGTLLAGTWRAKGYLDDGVSLYYALMQRVA